MNIARINGMHTNGLNWISKKIELNENFLVKGIE